MQASSIDLILEIVSNTNTNPRKQNIRNIIDNYVSMERRKVCDLSDAYYSRSNYLLQKPGEMEMIMGYIVNLTITPAWEGGQNKSYHTVGHEPQPFDSSTDVVIHQTPSKKEKHKNQVHLENICCLCGILW